MLGVQEIAGANIRAEMTDRVNVSLAFPSRTFNLSFCWFHLHWIVSLIRIYAFIRETQMETQQWALVAIWSFKRHFIVQLNKDCWGLQVGHEMFLCGEWVWCVLNSSLSPGVFDVQFCVLFKDWLSFSLLCLCLSYSQCLFRLCDFLRFLGRARETMPWSGRAIITGSVSCVTSQCDFVGAGISQLTQVGFVPFGDYLAR